MTAPHPGTPDSAPSERRPGSDLSHWSAGSLFGILLLIAALPNVNTLAKASEPNLAAYDHLGYIALRQRDFGRAEQRFKIALSLNPVDNQARLHLGTVYALTGRPAEARREYESVLASDPKNAAALAALDKLSGGTPASKSSGH